MPMAGRGSRFTEQGYTDSKPFIDVNGKPMIQRVIENLGIEFDKNYMFVLVCLQEDFDKYDFHQFKDIIGHDSYDVVILDDVTEGAAQTILYKKDLINDNTPLLTLNTDQMIDYNPEHMWTMQNTMTDTYLVFGEIVRIGVMSEHLIMDMFKR